MRTHQKTAGALAVLATAGVTGLTGVIGPGLVASADAADAHSPARGADDEVSHLLCETFVYTRTPYDPAVPVPGGHPTR